MSKGPYRCVCGNPGVYKRAGYQWACERCNRIEKRMNFTLYGSGIRRNRRKNGDTGDKAIEAAVKMFCSDRGMEVEG